MVATGTCLLQNCQLELAECLVDEQCAESLVCLQGCANKPNESDCQIRCGDLYSSKAVQTFNTCAVTKKNCVPQKQDTNEYPVPPTDVLVPEFSTSQFQGRWYIVAGLNRDFDTFDCQEHFFSIPEEGKLYAKINWRVARPNGQWYQRSDIQTFYQDDKSPAILHNNGNEYLHYQDDWYIPGYKEGKYVFIYYRGTNDAWDGYGGAVVYATRPDLDPAIVPELEEIAGKVGLKFSDFLITDNTCGPEPPLKLTRPADLEDLADDAKEVEQEIFKEARIFEEDVEKAGKATGRFLGKEVKVIEDDVEKAGEATGRFLGKEVKVIEKDFEALEQNLVSFGPRITMLKTDKLMGKKNVLKVSETKAEAEEMAEARRMLSEVEDRVRKEEAMNPVQRLFASVTSLFGALNFEELSIY